MILSETIGNYSQTIRLNSIGENEIRIERDNEVLYEGVARHIIDVGDKISFKDGNNKQHEYIKYATMTYA
jgi:hypothetical protein